VHPSHRHKVKPFPGDAVYEIRMGNGKGPVLERDSWGAAIVPELRVEPTDIHVAKHRYSGFWDNELDSVLRNLDITTLLVMGINLDRCVFTTVTDACNAGYDVVLLEDGTGTYSPDFCSEASLYLIERCFGFVSDTASLAAAFAAEAVG
jgi:nicotinamidase-related amidase